MVKKTEVQVFISCPGDVATEKGIVEQICKQFTAAIENYCKVIFRTKDWSTVVGSYGSRPQGDINDQIGEYDIYIGIWHKRFGSKTGAINQETQKEFESGTHEEFVIAEQRFKENKAPQIYLFFRKNTLASTNDLNEARRALDQAEKIEHFRKEQMRKGWVYSYDDHVEFQALAYNVLHKWMLKFCFDKKSDNRQQAVQISAVDLELLRHLYPAPGQPYIPRIYTKFNSGSNSGNASYFRETGLNDIFHLISTQKKIVILGDAGSGKSMELAYVANCFSQQRAPFLAVYKRLNLYIPQIKLAEFLGEQWSKVPKDVLVILLDGLDEIPPIHFDDVVKQILFFAEENPDVRIVVSCRTNFFKMSSNEKDGTLPGFAGYYLTALRWEDIGKFYMNKFPQSDPKSFLQALVEAELGELGMRPYFLMVLADLHYQRGNLKLSRSELLGLFLDTRIRIDKIHFNGVVDIGARKKMFNLLIERIALGISILGTNIIREEDLLELITYEQYEQLKYCATLKREGTDPVIWAFEHNNLQEYLAASALSKLAFDEVLALITFEPDHKKIIPTWVNTLTFLYSILDGGTPLLFLLTNWMAEHEPEIIVKMEADKIAPAVRTTLFQKIYEQFERKAQLVRSNTFSIRELAKFGESSGTIDYLLKQLSQAETAKVNRINALNLLGYFDYAKNDHGETVATAIIASIRENKGNDDLIHSAIYALTSAKLNGQWVLSNLLEIIGDNSSSYIRSSIYALLTESPAIDSYVDYILKGVTLLKSRYTNRKETRLADENWHLLHCIIAIREKTSLFKVIEFFKSDRFSEYGLDGKDVVEGIIMNAIRIFPQSPGIYNAIFSWWKYQVKYFNHRLTGTILRFFDETGTRERAFMELWQEARAKNDETFLYLANLATSPVINYIVKEYEERNATNSDLNTFYQKLNWLRSPLAQQFENLVQEKTGHTIEKQISRDFQAEFVARQSWDFALLFDKNSWMLAVNEVFDKEGKEKLSFDELFEIKEEKNILRDLEEIYSGSALRLLRDFCNPGEIVDRSEVIAWFDQETNFKSYQISLIYEHLTNNKELVLTASQREWLEGWCKKTAPQIDWKNSVRANEDGGATFNTFAMIVVYLVKSLEVTLPELTMLDLLYCDFREGDSGGILSYVETQIPVELVVKRVKENLEQGIEVDFILQNYVRYAVSKGLRETYPYILKEIVNKKRADYFRISILDIYYKGTYDNSGLLELLPSADKILRLSIVDYLIDTDKRPFVGEYLVLQFDKETDESERSKLAEYLIRMRHKEGIEYFIRHLEDDTYHQHPFERPGVLNHLNSIEMLPDLIKILELGCLGRGQLSRFETVVSAALNPIYSIGVESDNNFKAVTGTLENWMLKKGEDFPCISTVNDYLKRINVQYYLNKAKTSTIEDVKRKFQALGN